VFEPEASITHVAAAREQVVAVVESINQPQVSVPGRPPQPVSCHLIGLRNPDGTFGIVISLHLPRTGENVVYVHEKRQLAVEGYREVELEGLQFLESMGFMLDNLNFRNLDPALQEQVLRRIPLLAPPGAAAGPATPVPAGADRGRLARLLASF
jgi:hypothetical protein